MCVYIEDEIDEDLDLLERVTLELQSMGFNREARDTIISYFIDLKEILTTPFNRLNEISEL